MTESQRILLNECKKKFKCLTEQIVKEHGQRQLTKEVGMTGKQMKSSVSH